MNPLFPLTYYRRHKSLTLMLTALFALTIMGVYMFFGLAQETYIEPAYAINAYLTKFSLVQPELVPALDPDSVARIRANPDVAQMLPFNNVNIKVPNIGGDNILFHLIGLREADVETVLTQSGVTLKEGRLPQPGTNGVAISEEIVTALQLKIGDTFDRTRDERAYVKIVSPLQLVGILSGEVRLGIMSYEYLHQSEVYGSLVNDGLLVIAQPGREAAVENFLSQSIRNSQTKTTTRQSVSKQVARDQMLLYVLGLPITLLVSLAITLVVSAVNRLAFTQRLEEFGTLQALGFQKTWLARRLMLEMSGPALLGLVGGVLLAWGGLAILNDTMYAPRGFAFTGIPLSPLPLMLIVPLVVIGATLFTAVRTLGRMDAIAVVERGKLSMEAEQGGLGTRVNTGSVPRPLASTTYYQRHRRQAVAVIVAALLLIIGTSLLFFLFSATADAMQPAVNNLSRMSAVSPNNQPLDSMLVEQIRAHPEVERVIDVYAFVAVKISIPPIFPNSPVETLCVSAEDMAYLVSLYNLKLQEGHLPHPNTNEIVIPWVVAKNRDIQVGDIIGDPARPAYPGAEALPIPVIVSGILAPADTLAEETWFSFMSLEFVEQYRESDLSLIVVPKDGEKAALNAWLESQISGEGRIILTHGNQQAALQKQMRSMLRTFLLMESIITVVAALALAGLNHLFITQRQAEFGLLHALGFLRQQLVGRVLREMSFAVSAAWVAGSAVCLLILLWLQQNTFAAVGLKVDLFNLTPWLLTLPIPVAVLVVSAVTTAWMLRRLDPVAIIERR